MVHELHTKTSYKVIKEVLASFFYYEIEIFFSNYNIYRKLKCTIVYN